MVLEIEKNQTAENHEIMTTEDVALFLRVSISAVRRWSRDGKLKGH